MCAIDLIDGIATVEAEVVKKLLFRNERWDCSERVNDQSFAQPDFRAEKIALSGDFLSISCV